MLSEALERDNDFSVNCIRTLCTPIPKYVSVGVNVCIYLSVCVCVCARVVGMCVSTREVRVEDCSGVRFRGCYRNGDYRRHVFRLVDRSLFGF